MKKLIQLLCMSMISFGVISMQHPASKEEAILRQIKEEAKAYLVRNADLLVHTGNATLLELNKEQYFEDEVNKGQSYMSGGRRVYCAHNWVIFFDNEHQASHSLVIPSKVDGALTAAIKTIHLARLAGSSNDKILLGQEDGIILVGDTEKGHRTELKTLGQVNGPVLSFAVHPNGSQVAVRYLSNEERYVGVPCLALSVSHAKNPDAHEPAASKKSGSYIDPQLEVSKKQRRCSYISEGSLDWTPFLSRPCEHEVMNSITFQGNYCITECKTGNIERWEIANAANKPELKCEVIKRVAL